MPDLDILNYSITLQGGIQKAHNHLTRIHSETSPIQNQIECNIKWKKNLKPDYK